MTSFGICASLRDFIISLCGMLPYALATSSHVTTRLFFSFFASLINCDMTEVCSRHPDTPGMPPFWIDVSMYPFARTKSKILSDFRAKNSFPSTFRRDIVLNLSTSSAFSTLGIKTPSASLHVSLIVFLAHILLRY